MPRSAAAILALLSAAVLTAACASATTGTGEAVKTFSSTGPSGSTLSLSVTWKTEVGGGIGDRQLAGGSADSQHVYVDDAQGSVYALDPATGKVQWQVHAGTRTGTPVGNADGEVLYYDSNVGLSVLDGATGHTLWKFGTLGGGDQAVSQPAVSGGILCLVTENARGDGIGGYDLRTGKRRWLFSQQNYITTQVTPVAVGAVFVGVREALSGGATPQLVGLAASTGTLLWSAPLPGVAHDEQISLLAGRAGQVIVAAEKQSEQPTTMLAYDVRTHARQWASTKQNVDVGGGDPLGAVADGALTVGGIKGLQGISLATGTTDYTKPLDHGPADATGLCQGHACGVGLDKLVVVDGSGNTLGEFTEPDDANAAPPEPMLTSAGKTYLVNASFVYALG